MAYLKLIRPLNLLMIILTQLLFWFFIIVPIHNHYGSLPDLALWQVSLLIASTVLIAAAGYVINDYYDVPIDLINKPKKVIISQSISDDNAFNYYIVLFVSGIIASLIVAFTLDNIMLVILPLIISSLLWFYAQSFKRAFLVGNIVVAFSTAAVIFIIIYFEIDWERIERIPGQAKQIMIFGGAYMSFAFITSLLRELVKDLQDKEGDETFECKTMPIVAGDTISKFVAGFYILILLAGIGYCLEALIEAKKWIEFAYLMVLLIFPAIWMLIKLIGATSKKDYQLLSYLAKAIMFFGILTMIYIGQAM